MSWFPRSRDSCISWWKDGPLLLGNNTARHHACANLGTKSIKNGRRSIITTHASFSCCQCRRILYSCQGLDSFVKRPFPNCLVPLFQSEASCKTSEMAYWKKVSLPVTKSEDKFSPSKNISSFLRDTHNSETDWTVLAVLGEVRCSQRIPKRKRLGT